MKECQPSPFPQYHSLLRYCRMLAGTPWDGEDLLQDTTIKVLKTVPNAQERDELPLAYWFRVATNAWIDTCRKRKIDVMSIEYDDLESVPELQSLDIRDAIERLVYLLSPKQAAILLLVDVFCFTTRETSKLLEHMNEGAVKTALRRARAKIASLAMDEVTHPTTSPQGTDQLIERFTSAFMRNDPLLVVRAYHALAITGIQVNRYVTKTCVSFTFSDPDGNVIRISMSS